MLIGGVNAVVDGDKPYPVGGENLAQVTPGFDVFTPQAGQVFDNHAVNGSLGDVLHHFLKCGPVEQNAAVTVVHSLVYQRNVRVGGYKVLHQFFLVGNAVAFLALVSRIGKPQVCRCIVFCHKKITPLKFTDFPHKSKSDSDLPDAILFPLSV